MKKLITALVIAALLLTLSSTSVYAASGGVTGQGKGGNTAPTVVFVDFVVVGGDTQVTAMSPLAEYRIKATLGDINTIDDIQTVEFHIYYTSDGNNWDADETAIFKWTKAGGWTMENGGAFTTWAMGTNTTPLVFTDTTGDWYLGFIPGKLAQADAAANWHASVEVWDEHPSQTGTGSGGNASMGAYSEISIDVGTIVFGAAAGIEPGATGYIETPVTQYVTPQVGTNDTYELGIKSDATWDDGAGAVITLSQTTDTPPVPSGQFTLIVDDETSGAGAPKFATQGVTITNTAITGHGADGRTETVDNGDEGTSDTQIWIALSFSVVGILEVDYSGIITFTVTN